ncbi:hypothetical protein [Caldimonas brevitalea]|uniref:Uncharacterized protein n=1 Tax=Caldimonas brevitalea TaxID=413882 RepID=A0A0G3BNX2_9BURK|nr:hypothetical protein [Caldimonas brevitalea]AKJ31102.1 hypothetical protein AAW51_4411 [Caldimonas brevitalea]
MSEGRGVFLLLPLLSAYFIASVILFWIGTAVSMLIARWFNAQKPIMYVMPVVLGICLAPAGGAAGHGVLIVPFILTLLVPSDLVVKWALVMVPIWTVCSYRTFRFFANKRGIANER